ncbi:tetratricopeptide repeat protein [Aphanothece minutissima]|uniref:tetratricopeptide repeat protein n=1 Tax=Aphanothece minutissima TaxID=543815 RepID=UPI001C62E922|nr:tetratricopeptide repeat protein [Aphanothece minutissima]
MADMLQPSDGTTCRVISELLRVYELECVPRSSEEFYRVSQNRSLPCWELLEKGQRHNAENLLIAMSARRNDDILGHGLPSNLNIDAEVSALNFLFNCFDKSKLIPSADIDGSLFLVQDGDRRYVLKLLRMHDGNLSVYRRIKRLSTSKCAVEVQVELGMRAKRKDKYTVDFSLESNQSSLGSKSYLMESINGWNPLILIPQRETESFAGREHEFGEILDWLNDIDSRACMIYGDGGIGKTTFILELLHRLLEGAAETDYKPEIVTFFTAKRTRWGIHGLQIIDSSSPALDDLSREILMSLEGSGLQKDWYIRSGKELIEKLATHLQVEYGIHRKDHLIILDNTETLASNPDEVERLSREMRILSQKLGRLIVTSRRREKLEARHIEMPPLSEDESIDLLRRRAAELRIESMMQAGLPRLRKVARSCGLKPLILEVFIQAVKSSLNGSIDDAQARVVRMQRQDLGEFLYTDAWERINPEMKHLLLLMTRVGEVHDQASLNLCCDEVGLSSIEAYDALEESKGIARIDTYDKSIQIVFSGQFMDFTKDRTILLDGTKVPSPTTVGRISRRYSQFITNATTQIADRIQRAFRHPYAKAAYHAYAEGRYTDCEDLYKQALIEDPDNAWLYDRYAYLLMAKLGRLDGAHALSKHAIALCKDDPDIWFTCGMIERKLGLMNEAFTSISNAEAFGKPKHLCHLQKCFAAMNASPPQLPLAKTEYRRAEEARPKDDPYWYKFDDELTYARQWLTRLDQRNRNF